MSQNQTSTPLGEQKLQLVHVVTSYGNIIGVYADPQEAFNVQLLTVNKGRLCELVTKNVIYPENLKSK